MGRKKKKIYYILNPHSYVHTSRDIRRAVSCGAFEYIRGGLAGLAQHEANRATGAAPK